MAIVILDLSKIFGNKTVLKSLNLDGKLLFPPVQKPYPPLWFGGSSAVAQKIAAKHVDIYLTWSEPPAQVAEKIASVRRLALSEGRTLRFGIERLPIEKVLGIGEGDLPRWVCSIGVVCATVE